MTKITDPAQINPRNLLREGQLRICFMENQKEIINDYRSLSSSRIGIGFSEIGANIDTDIIKGYDLPGLITEYGDFKEILFNPAVSYIRGLLMPCKDLLINYRVIAQSTTSTASPQLLTINCRYFGANDEFIDILNPFKDNFILKSLHERGSSKTIFTVANVDGKVKSIFEKEVASKIKENEFAIRGDKLEKGLEKLVSLVENEEMIKEMLENEQKYNEMLEILKKQGKTKK